MTKRSVPPGSDAPEDRLGRTEEIIVITDVNDPRYAELDEYALQGPDGPEEHFFVPLEDDSPELADALKRRFVELWLREARLPLHRFEDALVTVELKVAPDEEPDRWRLRLRSFYTGTTYWLYEWDRSREKAETWVDEMAEIQGMNVNDDRKYGPTPWDEHRWGTPHPGHPRRRHSI